MQRSNLLFRQKIRKLVHAHNCLAEALRIQDLDHLFNRHRDERIHNIFFYI